MNSNEKSQAVTVEEAAEALGIGRGLAYKLARTGELPTIRLGHKTLRVPRQALDDLLASGRPQRR